MEIKGEYAAAVLIADRSDLRPPPSAPVLATWAHLLTALYDVVCLALE